jgi:two-component system, chemotaxis family, protein-glutamate methylesterase/glutaminase
MSEKRIEAILIGGSAGSFESFIRLVRTASGPDTPPIVGVFHLMRNVESHIADLLKFRTGKGQIAEAEEKEALQPGWVYLAPSNYHLLIEEDKTFCLDSSDLVEFSRPSIDVTFESAAQVYGEALAGILLSGSNADGSFGMQCIERKGGMTVVLDPEEADFKTMPLSCIQALKNPRIYTLSRIEAFLSKPHHE